MKSYWVAKVQNLDKVTINTPMASERSGAIANISVKGFTPQELADKLLKEFKIYTVAIDHPYIKGVRITPHLYTSIPDLDKFVEAIKSISNS